MWEVLQQWLFKFGKWLSSLVIFVSQNGICDKDFLKKKFIAISLLVNAFLVVVYLFLTLIYASNFFFFHEKCIENAFLSSIDK